MERKIEIYVSEKMTEDILQYIADCWIEFLVYDLNLSPSDGIMILPI